jgi:transcriptional regulator with XRE-family HTH domain
MEREELVRSEEFWTTNIQIALFELIENYLKENNLTKTQLAEKLGVTKGYVSQVLNGDFDHKISKLVQLSLACNIAPVITFVKLDDYLAKEAKKAKSVLTVSKKLVEKKKGIAVQPAKKKTA